MTDTTLRITVVRHQCPHCRRTWAKQPAATAHVGRCWLNPAARACKTCQHRDPGGDACGCETGCNWGSRGPVPPSCSAGVAEFDPAGLPVTGCPSWQQTALEGR